MLENEEVVLGEASVGFAFFVGGSAEVARSASWGAFLGFVAVDCAGAEAGQMGRRRLSVFGSWEADGSDPGGAAVDDRDDQEVRSSRGDGGLRGQPCSDWFADGLHAALLLRVILVDAGEVDPPVFSFVI